MALLIFIAIVVLLVLSPSLWVKHILKKHSGDRPDFPGTGGELARHLLDEADMTEIPVEISDQGDHYDPETRTVRLSPNVHDGRSLTAVAVAAHEFSHALQHADGYQPLNLRTRLAKNGMITQRIGSAVLLATPIIFVLTRAPAVMVIELIAGFAIMALSVVIHLVTLPVELDASFNRALPILKSGRYLDEDDLPAARQVLKAAAFTYVAAALMSLLNAARWLRVLR